MIATSYCFLVISFEICLLGRTRVCRLAAYVIVLRELVDVVGVHDRRTSGTVYWPTTRSGCILLGPTHDIRLYVLM